MLNFFYFQYKNKFLRTKYLLPLLAYTRILVLCFFIPAFLMVNVCLSRVEAFQSHSSYEQLKVKAAFVLNLARFVEWPNEPERKNINDIVMCFYQYNFLEQAIETIRYKKIQNKVIHFKVIQSLQIKERCDVVLVSATTLSDFLRYNQYDDLKNRITITDLSSEPSQARSLENKIIFRLKRDKTRLLFEINKKAAEQLGIKIGSELLKLGVIVTDPEIGKKFNDQGRNE